MKDVQAQIEDDLKCLRRAIQYEIQMKLAQQKKMLEGHEDDSLNAPEVNVKDIEGKPLVSVDAAREVNDVANDQDSCDALGIEGDSSAPADVVNEDCGYKNDFHNFDLVGEVFGSLAWEASESI